MKTFTQALNEALHESMSEDEWVFVMGEDVAHHGGMFRVTEGLLDKFGEKRVIDTPISESGFVGMALGAAMAGKRPVIELMFFDFALVAMDQLLNQVAKTHYMSGGTVKVPMVIRTQGGGYKGAAAQHSQMLEALFLHVPGLKVVAPSNPSDAKALLKAAIGDDNPVVFVEHKQLYGVKGPVSNEEIELGKAKVVREGEKATVVSYSYTLTQVLEATEGVEVIDVRTLNPLDFETIARSVRKTHRVMVAHEGHARCGFGADLAAQIQSELFDELDAPVKVVAAANVPVPYAKSLEDVCLPSVESIGVAVRELVR